ncbi:sulfatase-like hydrolase/transferase [Halosquirtibacter xylanolyticus]|uniref:sulfatase-like hydrolase/transferase n=1 Tax=Halosquirtibacter xylanolyticus TaxID=3374599 RepID=UPI003748B914|nr:sulfatase-like hydrolase/transferase [Prolixibacteraceae bacterium]
MRKVKYVICILFALYVRDINGKTIDKKQPPKQPNIVFFLIDDMGWKDLGCFGAQIYETPHIDRLCSDGVKFTNAYTSAPICSPARASALTGSNPYSMRMWNHLHYIPTDKKLLPAYLKEVGYQTWHVGKWHIGNAEQHTYPQDKGFDINIGGGESWGPGSYFWPYNCNKDGSPRNIRNAIPGLYKNGKEGEYLNDRLTDEAFNIIENRDPDKPFFLNFWHYAVHNNKEAKESVINKYKKKIRAYKLDTTYRTDNHVGGKLLTSETNATYAAMIESVDESIGRVVNKIKEIGEYENTLFIFYSDNGSTTEDVPCAPLNGGKNTTYEGGVRVPAFVVWNNHTLPASTYRKAIYIGDVFETILDAAQVKRETKTESYSWFPIFEGKELPNREFIWYYPVNRELRGQLASAAIYNEKLGMKYIMNFTSNKDELYDIQNDIAERDNIIANHKKEVTKLKTKLVSFMEEQYLKGLPLPPNKHRKNIESRLNIK